MSENVLERLRILPSEAVLSTDEAATFIGISRDTLRRLNLRGDGPAKLQLSPRRVGYQKAALARWLTSRTDQPSKTSGRAA